MATFCTAKATTIEHQAQEWWRKGSKGRGRGGCAWLRGEGRVLPLPPLDGSGEASHAGNHGSYGGD
jgi:hypothetical protein